MDIHNCIECNIEMPLEKITDSSGYIRKRCYQCKYKQTKATRELKKEENLKKISKITVKICIGCNQEKNVVEFNKRLISNDGYNTYCKKCYKARRKVKAAPEITIIQAKKCIKCIIDKPIIEYKTTKQSKDGYFHTCNACLKPVKWNKEKQKLSEKKYIENNKEKLREKWRRAGKQINRMVRGRLNARIRDAMKKSGQQKNNKTSSFIGCDVEYIKKWFEFQFTDTMNWETFHLWHIDHVNPCNAYDLSNIEEQLKCFHWTNLRPCWINDNLSKSGTIDTQLIENHKTKVQQFILQSTTKLS